MVPCSLATVSVYSFQVVKFQLRITGIPRSGFKSRHVTNVEKHNITCFSTFNPNSGTIICWNIQGINNLTAIQLSNRRCIRNAVNPGSY